MDHPDSKNRLGTVLIVLVLAVVAGAMGYYVSRAAQRPAAVQVDLAQSGWSCPMHPDYVSGQPGNCPICGMALVRTSTGQLASHSDQFHVPPQAQRRCSSVVPVALTGGRSCVCACARPGCGPLISSLRSRLR